MKSTDSQSPTPVWVRNAAFIGLSICGLAFLASMVLPKSQIGQPNASELRPKDTDFERTVSAINHEFQSHWQVAELQHAERSDDLAIARRLSLALTGTVPSLEEIREFESKPKSERIDWWLDHLLSDRRYADYVAERFARAFVGTEGGPFILYRRDRFKSWLSDSLYENRRYDELVRAMIAGKGIWTSSPEVNYLTVTATDDENRRPDPIKLAARTSRAFLGLRIDCLQCHDNNLPDEFLLGSGEDEHDGTQRDFHRLAAFFSETNLGFNGVGNETGRPYRYRFLFEEEEEAVDPAFPYALDVDVSQESPRDELATWLTHSGNKPFSRAIVNRIWALMFGRPLTLKIDDIALHGYPAEEDFEGQRWWSTDQPFPPGMNLLAEDFVRHDYDLRRLIRMIAMTQVFQIDSKADVEVTSAHEEAFAVFPLTRLRPEQVGGSVIQSCSTTTIDSTASVFAKLAQFGDLNEFLRRYGDIGEDEFVDSGGTIPQRLVLLNGKMTNQRVQFSGLLLNAASAIDRLATTNESTVENVCLAVLTRRPTEKELSYFARQLDGKRGRERTQQVQTLFLKYFSSTEFSWNH